MNIFLKSIDKMRPINIIILEYSNIVMNWEVDMSYLEDNITSFYKAMAHPTRLRILNIVKEHDEICVCNINDDLELEQSNVSQHLKVLKNSGLLTSRKEGLKVMYSLTDRNIITVMNTVNKIISSQLEKQLQAMNTGE